MNSCLDSALSEFPMNINGGAMKKRLQQLFLESDCLHGNSSSRRHILLMLVMHGRNTLYSTCSMLNKTLDRHDQMYKFQLLHIVFLLMTLLLMGLVMFLLRLFWGFDSLPICNQTVTHLYEGSATVTWCNPEDILHSAGVKLNHLKVKYCTFELHTY